MNPSHFRCFLWTFNRSICSSFIPGISIGTSFSYLKAAAVLMTGTDFAKLGSILSASSDSSAVNTRSNESGLIWSTVETIISRTYSGTSFLLCHLKIAEAGSLKESKYFFPADLEDETTAVNSNHGCLFNANTNSWPTAPVAPISATFNIRLA
jgi:hypothetical protein